MKPSYYVPYFINTGQSKYMKKSAVSGYVWES